jgi:hypothetical protein
VQKLASAEINKSPAVQETCLKDPAEDSSTLSHAPSLCFDFAQHPEFVEGPKGETTTSSNSSVSNVRNSLPDDGLEEK